MSGLKHVAAEQPEKLENIQLCHTNVFDIVKEYGKESFDFVYGVNIIEHIPRTAELLEQIYQVLRPGGMVYIQGANLECSERAPYMDI